MKDIISSQVVHKLVVVEFVFLIETLIKLN